jgi:ABC-type transporter Mla subunit MlaD
MPSLGDFYDRLGEVNNHVGDMDTELTTLDTHVQQTNTQLGTIEGTLTSIAGTLTSIDGDIQQMSQSMTTLLTRVVAQNDTIICILEHISRNTCSLVNAAALELRALQSVEVSARELDSMTKTVHPDAALVLARDEAARLELEKCCPPKHIEAPCHYQPCEQPEKPGQSSHVAVRRGR